MGVRGDAASTLFNLPDYRVVDAVDLPGGGRRVQVETTSPPGCPACGVLATKVHSRRLQRIGDVPIAGALEVIWCKRRWFCDEAACPRGTFCESTAQNVPRARSTSRLRAALVPAVVASGRAAAETARAHGVSWWSVQAALTAAVLTLPDVDQLPVTRLGIDEHRYRSVGYYRDGVGAWLAARPQKWRDDVQVVAIDPSPAFRKALGEHLPRAAVSVNVFHLVMS